MRLSPLVCASGGSLFFNVNYCFTVKRYTVSGCQSNSGVLRKSRELMPPARNVISL